MSIDKEGPSGVAPPCGPEAKDRSISDYNEPEPGRVPLTQEDLDEIMSRLRAVEPVRSGPLHGKHFAHLQRVVTFKNKNGTRGIELVFRICEGDFEGRVIRHPLWLTDKALPYTATDLARLGLTDISKLDHITEPARRIRVLLKFKDDEYKGKIRSKVASFEVIGFDDDIRPGGAHSAAPLDGADQTDNPSSSPHDDELPY